MTSQATDHQELQKAFDQAVEQHRAGKVDAALQVYQQVREAMPDHAGALHMLGVVALQKGEEADAEDYLKQAVHIEPDNSKMLNNYGNSLYQLRRFSEAADAYQRAMDAEQEAIDPIYNLGTALFELGDFAIAIEKFDRALALEPLHGTALLNKGVCHKELKQFAEAAFCFRTLLDTQPDNFAALVNLANVLAATEAWDEAQIFFQRAGESQPDHAGVHLELLKLAQGACDFDGVARHYENLLMCLPKAICESTDWQFLASVIYQNIFTEIPANLIEKATTKFETLVSQLAQVSASIKRTDKIRVGYMSSNFGDHPVGHVTSALFQAHDRERFEIMGFSLNDRTAERQTFAKKLKSDFDEFYQIGSMPPEQAAREIAELGIQILIDIDGFMSSRGLRIQAHRPAPIQLYWLGHAGGVGQTFVDYVIADQVVVPETERAQFIDKVLYLPEIYHCAAPHPVSKSSPERTHFNLPEAGQVFCAFNNPEKIDQNIFTTWMKILRAVPDSVLWLSSKRGLPLHSNNLKAQAKVFGVSSDRLIFADRVENKADHLARHRHACLFLDTLTLNASTTALDSLWAGLPILAVAGDRFSSRISQTMLHAVGMPEMICADIETYVARAVEIATDADQEQALKDKLSQKLTAEPLFDVGRFTKNLEQVYLNLSKDKI